MQNDYFVMIDNHFMLLIEPIARCVDIGHINKLTKGIVKYIHEISLKIEKYLDFYTEQQKTNWKNSKKIVVYENKAQLIRFIEDAKERKKCRKEIVFWKNKKGSR